MLVGQVLANLRMGWRGLTASLALLLFASGCAASVPPTPTPAPTAAPTPTPHPVVTRLQDVAEFERLKGQGQPTVLVILDEAYR